MSEKTRILILGSSPVLPSGKAETTRVIFGGLLQRYGEHYEIYQVGLFHSVAITKVQWPVRPTRSETLTDGSKQLAVDDLLGQETVREELRSLRPDILIIFTDTSSLAALGPEFTELSCKLLLYIKNDNWPIALSARRALVTADHIITMSKFSRRSLLTRFPTLSPSKVTFLYSPADTSRFGPISEEMKRGLRNEFLPGWMPKKPFILGWVGRPCWRKQVWLLYKLIHYLRTGKYKICKNCERISLLDWDPATQCHLDQEGRTLESRPDRLPSACSHCGSVNLDVAEPLVNAILWLHMWDDDPSAGWPLTRLEEEYAVQRNRDVYYTEGCSANAALAPADMPTLYRLWDALIYLSGAEGFGLPAWEAMCSALPVIYTDFSSHSEYLNDAQAGLRVGGILQPEPKTGFLRMVADLPEAIRAVRQLYFDAHLRESLGVKGRDYVQQFRVERQIEEWHEVLQTLRLHHVTPPSRLPTTAPPG